MEDEKQDKSGKKSDMEFVSETLNKFFIGLAITEALSDASYEQLIEITKILGI